ncbi:hypothetical protein B0A48_12121 [Cryoendolithus antarcticus]|uniref:Uncharacterized protein n=1 Tax=Cryoendolithus antarcticus TaxID=1507870 RepID=A0A1V8STU9_9PEZI|nr:hypothetical protein B0A48_12121 [Cryoendolithus antarcticus]
MSQQFNNLPIHHPRFTTTPAHPAVTLRSVTIDFAAPLIFLRQLSTLQTNISAPDPLHPLLFIPTTPTSLVLDRTLDKVIIDLCTRLVDSATFHGNVLPYNGLVEILTGLPPLTFRDLQRW